MSRGYTPLTGPLAAYVASVTLREPDALRELRESNQRHPCATMQIAPEQGQFLHVLVKLIHARKALEIGVFMGYSSSWVALAMPLGSRLVACEASEEYAAIARNTWNAVGVDDSVELRLGPALDSLNRLLAEGHAGTFDFAFIDADKANYSNYYDLAYELVKPGGLIAADNTLWDGNVADPAVQDADTESIRAFNRKLYADSRVALTLATIGDGVTLACKL
jgi:predicted O-methyltransferase YrrM